MISEIFNINEWLNDFTNFYFILFNPIDYSGSDTSLLRSTNTIPYLQQGRENREGNNTSIGSGCENFSE